MDLLGTSHTMLDTSGNCGRHLTTHIRQSLSQTFSVFHWMTKFYNLWSCRETVEPECGFEVYHVIADWLSGREGEKL